MGICSFCKQPAGFLKTSHQDCRRRYDQGKAQIVALVGKFASGTADLGQLQRSVTRVAKSCYINSDAVRDLVIAGWERAVSTAFDDGMLTEEEEAALSELKDSYSLSQEMLDRNGAYTRIFKGAVLRDVLNGIVPERLRIDGNLPFNFLKSERLVWVFQNVSYYEERTRTRYVGGSQGVSVRIAKGLYYRVGAFKAEPVRASETIHADTGLFGVTDKHIYFAGAAKRFRIPYKKIVAFEPFSDGLGVQRDAQTAKPQTFVTGDGWFTYNLVTNLAQM